MACAVGRGQGVCGSAIAVAGVASGTTRISAESNSICRDFAQQGQSRKAEELCDVAGKKRSYGEKSCGRSASARLSEYPEASVRVKHNWPLEHGTTRPREASPKLSLPRSTEAEL